MFADPHSFASDVARLPGIGSVAGGDRQTAAGHLDQLAVELDTYFEGALTDFTVALDLRVGSAWDRLILEGVGSIPHGRVATYGEVAARIGRVGAARAVGGAVGRNPIGILIPCHRVIAAGGALGGYGGDCYGTRRSASRSSANSCVAKAWSCVMTRFRLGTVTGNRRAGGLVPRERPSGLPFAPPERPVDATARGRVRFGHRRLGCTSLRC